MLNLRLAGPSMVVDISKVPELRGVTTEGGGLQVGACVTHSELEDGIFPALRGHPLQRAAGVIAYRAVRNRGTIGGSLAHADPAADWTVVLTALGAELELVSPRGRRRLALAEFMQGAYTTALAADEIVATVRLPAYAPDSRWGYYKICRKTGEFAEASCAALLAPSTRTARIAVGALDGAPKLLSSLAADVARDGLSAAGRRRDAGGGAWPAAATGCGRSPPVRQRGRAMPGAGTERGGGGLMNKISLEINGRRLQREVAPRTHLGDFLREDVRLTGTHLGCEHGVCGACTVLVDGQPVRSCITFAVACDGARVTTVEGYDEDPIMMRLRPAFTRHHALQCGFCTPGMLATARDIVLRLPDADEHRVRIELSGNLCRCTGYMGIVAAVMSVLKELQQDTPPEIEALRKAVREGRAAVPAASKAESFRSFAVEDAADASAAANAVIGSAAAQTSGPRTSAAASVLSSSAASKSAASTAAGAGSGSDRPAKTAQGTQIEGHFDVPVAADRVWAFMIDLPAVAGCLPGATVTSMEGDKVKGKVAVKFGPMSAAFNGAARLERDDAGAVGHAAWCGTGQPEPVAGQRGHRLPARIGFGGADPGAHRHALFLAGTARAVFPLGTRQGLRGPHDRRLRAQRDGAVAGRHSRRSAACDRVQPGPDVASGRMGAGERFVPRPALSCRRPRFIHRHDARDQEIGNAAQETQTGLRPHGRRAHRRLV